MENEITEKIERWKIKADALKVSNKHAFIKDINDTWYFCDIINFDEYILTVKYFKGDKMDQVKDLFWSDVILLEQYKEEHGEW
jgi:hypothetical protein